MPLLKFGNIHSFVADQKKTEVRTVQNEPCERKTNQSEASRTITRGQTKQAQFPATTFKFSQIRKH